MVAKKPPRETDNFVGQKIMEWRLTRGYTQQQLGEKLGVSGKTINSYETGRHRISAGRIWDVAIVLAVSLLNFFPDGADVIAVEESEIIRRLRAADVAFMRRFVRLSEVPHGDVARRAITAILGLALRDE